MAKGHPRMRALSVLPKVLVCMGTLLTRVAFVTLAGCSAGGEQDVATVRGLEESNELALRRAGQCDERAVKAALAILERAKRGGPPVLKATLLALQVALE